MSNSNNEIKHCNQILKKGYTIINNVLKKKECDKIKALAKYLFKKYSSSTKIKNPLEQTVYNLHNKNNFFIKYINQKKIISIIKRILSYGSYKNNEDIILRQTALRNPLLGNAQQLHNDTRIIGCKFPLVIHAIYMIDDFTIYNGPTRVIAGSHRFNKYAENNKNYKKEKLILGKKGSVLLFDASLWHGSAKKISNKERWAMIYSYSRWFLKPDFDHTKNTPINVYKKLNNMEKSLLGFMSAPPKDEFSRGSARSIKAQKPEKYHLPF